MSTPLLENIRNQPEALRATRNYLSGEGRASLLRAAQLLQAKRRVVLSGMGASLFTCISFTYSLLKRSWQAAALDGGELLYFLSDAIDSETVVILVSRSGESVEILKLLPELRKRGSAVISIVNVSDSVLQSESDEAIVLHCPADQMVAIQTYSATVVAFTLLAAVLAGDLEDAFLDLDDAIGALARFLPDCLGAREGWGDFLAGANPLYVLGRGPTLGSVHEAILLLHETAKAPAIGMSAAQFRHGPVEVVDERFRGIVIGTQTETQHLEEALAGDLMSMGGQVRWIGPAATSQQVKNLCAWPADLPQRFSFLGEIVPLQLAAYRKAELNGIRPGGFRWAPLVTTTEMGFVIPSQRR
ncbi:MAG TPA: SIS domain-containing protein [Bryobacteraceae bacterium]|nr:SIS domain-containing protein [Bryobacteraceae bacterium]